MVDQSEVQYTALIAAAVAAVVSLIVAYLNSLLTQWRDQAAKRLVFTEKQLAEFYSPLLGLRAEIRARSELRENLQQGAQNLWPTLVEQAQQLGGVEAMQALQRERYPDFERLIEWDNNNFYTTLLPAYRKMIDVFREGLWLADPETRPYLSELIEFVEVWERFIDKSLPKEIPHQIGHREANLNPFYEHIEAKHTQLRQRLVEGKA
jgi:hypothetical protein